MRVSFLLLAFAAALVAPALDAEPVPPQRSMDILVPLPVRTAKSDEYDGIVRKVFAKAYDSDVRVRVLFKGPPYPESMAGLRQEGDRFVVFYSQSPQWLWRFTKAGRDEDIEFDSPVSGSPADIRLETSERVVAPELAARIVSLWRRMLEMTARDPNRNWGFDGTDYDFSMEVDGRMLNGTTWSPENGRLRALASLADAVEEYAQHGGTGHLAALETAVTVLETLLNGVQVP